MTPLYWGNADDEPWDVTFSLLKRDEALVLRGSREQVVKLLEERYAKLGETVEIDAFTDQIDVWRVRNGRRTRLLILMA